MTIPSTGALIAPSAHDGAVVPGQLAGLVQISISAPATPATTTPAPVSETPAASTAPIHPAQTSETMTTTPLTPTTPSATDPIAPSTPAADQNELRIRHFQSEADRLRAELAAKERQATEALQALDVLKGSQQTLLQGVNEATQQALAQNAELAKQIAAERAERLRAEALMRNPELVPYADFIPATTDAAALSATIERLATVRKGDLERQRQELEAAAQPAAAQTPGVASAIPHPSTGLNQPGALVPAANPARPAPSGALMAGASADAQGAMLRAAMEESLARKDPSIFQRAVEQAAQVANAQVAQQLR